MICQGDGFCEDLACYANGCAIAGDFDRALALFEPSVHVPAPGGATSLMAREFAASIAAARANGTL
jgi:hypothetical protein